MPPPERTTTRAPSQPTRERTPPTPSPDSPAAQLQESAGNAAVAGLAEDGSFRIDLGRGIHLGAEELEGERGRVVVEFDESAPQPVPGLRLRRFVYRRNRDSTLHADIDVPMVDNVRGGVQVRVDQEGRPSFQGRIRPGTGLGVFQDPEITLSIDEEKNVVGELSIGPSDLTPGALRGRLTVEADGTIRLANGRLSGSVGADLTYRHFGTGRLDVAFGDDGRLSGSGHVEITEPYLQGARADLTVAEGDVRAEVGIPAASLQPPVAGLEVVEGTVRLVVDNTVPSGALEAVRFRYAGLGEALLDARIEDGRFTGGGSFDITIAELTDVSGRIRYDRQGRLSGSATIRSTDFPEGLPVHSGRITGTLRPDGGVDFSGQVGVTLGPAGSGELRASWVEGRLDLGTTIDLEVPGLQGARFTIDYVEGRLEGEADVPIDTEYVQGISGDVHVEYREGRWAGETELTYDADDGKLHGTIRIRVRQTEEGGLAVSGGGDVTARIAPRLEGTLRVEVQEDGTTDLSGAITVTEPVELFPEWRDEKELFRISQNIPLWAILVAVIRIRGGVRAGIGPGVFRDITVAGEYTIGPAEGGATDAANEPSLSISGEMFIPAFVEGYVAFGAGLGLDVVLGSLTGGIEGVATAGIYGAVSVVPVLAYRNGDYMIEGTATLAAGARLKLGLNAWAEVEAAWVTVWEETWELAEWVWSVGPDLALQARMEYVFGRPEPPSVEFSTSDIDSDRLIRDAMPEDGPPSSGAREATENRAQWQGDTQRPGRDAGRLPAEAEERSRRAPAEAADAPSGSSAGGGRAQRTAGTGAPGGPGGGASPGGGSSRRGPGGGGDRASGGGRGGAAQDRERGRQDAASRPTGTERTVSPDETPTSDQPRYPRPVTLATLEEPPAPTPRTREQMMEDVRAAARAVRLAAERADSTEELGTWFQRIRTRFRMASVGFVDRGGGRLLVRCSVNPDEDVTVDEKVQGTGIAGWQTNVEYRTSTLAGTTVGSVMDADPLGPDHPRGGPPGSDHDGLMARLVTDPGESSDSKYIRGHLLNDNVGGPGSGFNLFPITAQANRQHESAIESRVKTWVNDQRYWVRYRVRVDVSEVSLSDPDPRKNKVDASFVAEAAILDTEGGTVNTVNATIASVFRAPQPAPDVTETRPEAEAGHQARQADLAAPAPRLSSRHRDRAYTLEPAIMEALRTARRETGWSRVREALLAVPGLGPVGARVLLKAYANAVRNGNTDQSSLLSQDERAALTRLNGLSDDIVAALSGL